MASWEELTELRYIGERSAKKLFEKGYKTRNSILQADAKELAKIIGPVAYRVKKENYIDYSKFFEGFFEGKLLSFIKENILNGLGLFKRLLKKKKEFTIGIYGPTNAGKTTLANRISMDFLGETVGTVSRIPHETTEVTIKEGIELTAGTDGEKIRINLADTPGLATKLEAKEFEGYGLSKREMEERKQKAAMGVIEAIKCMDKTDIALFMLDAAKDTGYENILLLENFRLRKIPVIVVANKIDIKKTNVEKIKEKYPNYKIIGISAQKGHNMDEFYKSVAETAASI